MKRKVLFLCTGNSCRSQMAEATPALRAGASVVNERLGDEWEAVSAGTKPAGFVYPKALEALGEIGIQHDGHSKQADEFRDVNLDLFPDPAKTDNMDDFSKVRDNIAREIPELLRQFG